MRSTRSLTLFNRLDPQPLAIEIRHLGCPASAQ
jgi:hypothetical protein